MLIKKNHLPHVLYQKLSSLACDKKNLCQSSARKLVLDSFHLFKFKTLNCKYFEDVYVCNKTYLHKSLEVKVYFSISMTAFESNLNPVISHPVSSMCYVMENLADLQM
jgi:UV DNA damage repair endonuclease